MPFYINGLKLIFRGFEWGLSPLEWGQARGQCVTSVPEASRLLPTRVGILPTQNKRVGSIKALQFMALTYIFPLFPLRTYTPSIGFFCLSHGRFIFKGLAAHDVDPTGHAGNDAP